MNWQELDVPTRVGFVAAVIAVVGLIVPPIAIASAVIAVGFSGVAWQRSRRDGVPNPVAKFVLLGCAALIVVVIAGNAIYSAAN